LFFAAFAVGIGIAALPILTTRDRPCAAPGPPHPHAPTYLTLTSDPRIEELRCAAHGDLAFARIHTPAEADALLDGPSVAGVILDRASYGGLRPGQLREWLTAEGGRVLVSLDLTAFQLGSEDGGPPPPDPALPSSYLGDSYYGHRAFKSAPGRGACGSGGTTPYRGAAAARVLVERLLAWASPGGGCTFGS